MITKELEAHILRLFHAEHWPVGTIAREVGVHHATVHRVLAQAGQEPLLTLRPTMADPYMPFIRETLAKYPKLHASRLFQMVKERGYPGKESQFRAIIARVRPRPKAEAYQRLRTLPGEQAQVDWGHFGKVKVGDAERRLYGFVMVLSWSRAIFVRFYLGHDHTAFFLRGHQEAFDFFGGVPRCLLYDNLKSAVLERVDLAIRFNPRLLEFAGHYRFEPRPVAVARGNEKGRVERAIRYIRDNFFAARQFRDLDDLNAQALAWCQGTAMERSNPEVAASTVGMALETERQHLLAQPDNPLPCDERVEVRVGKTPYVRFDLNDYSVPHTHVLRTLVVLASPQTVRILDGNTELARHVRTYDRGRQIEDPEHLRVMTEEKRQARHARGLDRLQHAVPRCRKLYELLAQRGQNLGGTTSKLLKLLDLYGAVELDAAIEAALAAGRAHLGAIQQVLDTRRHAAKLAPPVSSGVSELARAKTRHVAQHPLADYATQTATPGTEASA